MDHFHAATTDQPAVTDGTGAAAGGAGMGLADRPWFVAIALVAWIAPGVAAAMWLRRQGHSLGPMLVLGTVFGPLFLPLSTVYRRRGRAAQPVVVVDPHVSPDVLVGIAEPAGLRTSVTALHDVLGDRRAIVLATFADRDSLIPGAEWSPAAQEAARQLEEAAELVREFTPAAVLLPGPPDHNTLREFARKRGISHVVMLDGPNALSVVSSSERR